MALVWCDGFEGYGDTDSATPAPTDIIGDKYLAMSYENQMQIKSAGRTDWALRMTPTAYQARLVSQDVVSGNTTIAGVAMYLYQKSGFTWPHDWPILCFKNTSGEMNVELIIADGTLFVNGPNTTYLGGTRVNLDVAEYHYVEMKVYHHNTSGTVEVRVNGCPVFSATNVDTVNTGGTTSRVLIGDTHEVGDNQLIRVDDFYVCDGTGSKNNDFLGDVSVRTLWPDGDDTTQFATTGNGSKATHYEQVNMEETLRATDYVEDGTSGNRDKYTLANAADNFNTVHGIMVWAQSRYETSATNYHLLIDSNGTEAETSNIAASATFAYDGYVWEDDPDTASAWTNSTINALKSGFEVQ